VILYLRTVTYLNNSKLARCPMFAKPPALGNEYRSILFAGQTPSVRARCRVSVHVVRCVKAAKKLHASAYCRAAQSETAVIGILTARVSACHKPVTNGEAVTNVSHFMDSFARRP